LEPRPTVPEETDKCRWGLLILPFHPHLDHEWFPENSLANLELLASTLSASSYAIEDQTAIKAEGDTIEVVSEGNGSLFEPAKPF
jgi:dipeptidase E